MTQRCLATPHVPNMSKCFVGAFSVLPGTIVIQSFHCWFAKDLTDRKAGQVHSIKTTAVRLPLSIAKVPSACLLVYRRHSTFTF